MPSDQFRFCKFKCLHFVWKKIVVKARSNIFKDWLILNDAHIINARLVAAYKIYKCYLFRAPLFFGELLRSVDVIYDENLKQTNKNGQIWFSIIFFHFDKHLKSEPWVWNSIQFQISDHVFNIFNEMKETKQEQFWTDSLKICYGSWAQLQENGFFISLFVKYCVFNKNSHSGKYYQIFHLLIIDSQYLNIFFEN